MRLKGQGKTFQVPRTPWMGSRHGRRHHRRQRDCHSLWTDAEQLDGIPGMGHSSGAVCSPNQTHLKCLLPEKGSGEAHLLFLSEFPGTGVMECLDDPCLQGERGLRQESENGRDFAPNWRQHLDPAYPFLPRAQEMASVLTQNGLWCWGQGHLSDHKERPCW